jgi:hypothetical protein
VSRPGGAFKLTGEPVSEETAVRGEYGDWDRLIGVNWVRGDTSGEKRYLPVRSVSVPYPLSISDGRTRRCLATCSFIEERPQCVLRVSGSDEASDLHNVYAGPSSLKRTVSCAQYRTVAGSMRNFEKHASLGCRHMEGKSFPNTGVSAHRMS